MARPRPDGRTAPSPHAKLMTPPEWLLENRAQAAGDKP